MSTSIREYIMLNVVACVKNVKGHNGYDNDIDDERVYRSSASVDTDLFPTVYVFEGDETVIEREIQGTATSVIKDMDVLVEVWQSSFDNLAQKINSLEADIIKAVMADSDRGGYAMLTEQTGSTPFFYGDENTGGRIISFNIRYEHKETDPYTA